MRRSDADGSGAEGVSLHIVFEDTDLERLATDSSYRQKRLSSDVVKSFRKKVQILRAAVNEMDLYAMRSLRLEKLKGDRAGTSSIRLNDQFRLIVRFETSSSGRVTIVIEIVDYH